jgi:hypothetical protein
MRLMSLILTFEFLTVGLAARAESSWPEGTRLRLDRCSSDSPVTVTGNIAIDSSQTWTRMTVGAVAVIHGPNGERALNSSLDLNTLVRGRDNPFLTGFSRGLLGPGETVISCGAFFVRGARIIRKAAMTTGSDTPVAKDEDCFSDFIKAMDLKGLDGRKKLAELLEYGCIAIVPSGSVADISRNFLVDSSRGKLAAVESSFRELGESTKRWSGFTLAAYLISDNIPVPEYIEGETTPTAPK